MSRLSLGEIENLLRISWRRDTSADPSNWSSLTPSWGQCAVSTLVIQDFFGGDIIRSSLEDVVGYEEMRSHYWNRLPYGAQLDSTRAQFSPGAYKTIPGGELRTREYLLSNDATLERYARLRLAIEAEIQMQGGDAFTAYIPNPLFFDPYYLACFGAAQFSECQKLRVGSILVHNGEIVASGANKQLSGMKHLCDPECIRFEIPSRTDSLIGACAHSEEYAVHEAIRLGIPLDECSLYVASFDVAGNSAHFRSKAEFTCIRCATLLSMSGIIEANVPLLSGWESVRGEDIIGTALPFALLEQESEGRGL